jgi:polysaccharide pyruvyl transferase WcaK-like protein
MNVFLVGDNSSSANWGGRAGSIALQQLLRKRFEITASVRANTFLLPGTGWTLRGRDFLYPNANFGYVNTLLPPSYNWLFLNIRANRYRNAFFRWYVWLEEFCGAKDFVSHNPVETVDNIRRYKSKDRHLAELYESAAKADVIIIHGEGDLVLSTPPSRPALFLLGMAELGLDLKKKVVFVNSIISDPTATGRNQETLGYVRSIFSRCDAVFVRDLESLQYVRSHVPDARVAMIPDSLFSWYSVIDSNASAVPANGDFVLPFPENKDNLGKLDFSKPYICLGGSDLASRDSEKSAEHFLHLLERIRELGHPVYLVEACRGDSFMQTVATISGAGLVPVYTSTLMAGAILANARLFVSGRYHPSIFAAMGGTPCVFLRSTGHKMRSLQEMLEYESSREFPVYLQSEEIDSLLRIAEEYLEQGETLRRSIKATAARRSLETLSLPDRVFEAVATSEAPASRSVSRHAPHGG